MGPGDPKSGPQVYVAGTATNWVTSLAPAFFAYKGTSSHCLCSALKTSSNPSQHLKTHLWIPSHWSTGSNTWTSGKYKHFNPRHTYTWINEKMHLIPSKIVPLEVLWFWRLFRIVVLNLWVETPLGIEWPVTPSQGLHIRYFIADIYIPVAKLVIK